MCDIGRAVFLVDRKASINGPTKLFFRFPGAFTHRNLPQGDFALLDFRWHVRGLEAAQMDGQMYQVQTEAHFIECLFIHSMKIGRSAGSL